MEKTYTANKSTAGTKGATMALIASLVSLPIERSNNTKNAVIPVPYKNESYQPLRKQS